MADGYLYGWPPGEESFTDFNLQDIRREHGDRVAIRQFTRGQEVMNGADWEWWFHDGTNGFGMRVQAKKAMRNGSYRLRYRPGKERTGRLQSLRLIEDAVVSGCLPFYVLYNHRNWVPYDEFIKPIDCRHGQADQRQMGCTLVSALVVQRVLDEPGLPASHVREVSVPWNRLVCEDLFRHPVTSTLDALANEARHLHLQSIDDHEHTISHLLTKKGRSDGIPEPEQAGDRRSALYRQVARIADEPVRPLPERVIGMIHDDVTEQPDERLAGVVLVDLTEE
ncbi:DUF6615 family protein [Streptomyces coeruleorubidus]|uniref:DUF6615 family protein n=1 Tax=Streptomyces coeruleorubidus TaxID=116188 RepID=UPI0033CDFC48